jgi:hypothetical protein
MSGADVYGSDEYCPHCDNHFVIDAVTPKAALQVEGDDARIDSRYVSFIWCYFWNSVVYDRWMMLTFAL